jgi:hypothetical protein
MPGGGEIGMRVFMVFAMCGLLAGCGLMARKEREEAFAAAKAQRAAKGEFPVAGPQYLLDP